MTSTGAFRCGAWFGLILLFLCCGPASAAAEPRTLSSGWFLWDPYQYEEIHGDRRVLVGLDVELLRAIAARAGYEVSRDAVAWHRHFEQMRLGERDMASGATWSEARATYLHYSIPYRNETNVLYLRRGDSPHHGFDDVPGMLRAFTQRRMRIGVIEGFVYADARINDWIADPANAAHIVLADSDRHSLQALIEGEVDGVLADRVVAATTAWREGWRGLVEEYPRLRVSTPIHLVFSRRSVSPEVVAAFDAAIADLKTSGEYRRIVASHAFPVLLSQTIDRDWFRVIEYIGVIAFALSGVLLAFRGRYDIMGALVLAALPAVGGGVMRDLILGRQPNVLVSTPVYVLLIGGTVLGGLLFLRLLPYLRRLLHRSRWSEAEIARVSNRLVEVFDAAGLAVFTVTGVVVAVSMRVDPLWLWGPLFAALTGAGGGVLRDVLVQNRDIPTLKGELYPEVALLWGLVLSLFLTWHTRVIDPNHILIAVMLTVLGAFATRMAAVHFGIRSLMYR